ncbi:beta-1,3-glucan-binding protein [Aethina tumida]|uniref:beta-1,3-glucan-binding protein n=1 Tax=Aethina tumida TaxID=116153 RepID=UPI00096B63DD|nr:beta-1,3-glucan-binding protein [Aethina tumida]
MLHIVFLLTVSCFVCACGYVIPDPLLEVYESGGFKVSIPAEDDMQLLGFHANLNKEISQIDPGIYKQDITAPENGLFAFTEPSAKLAIGDTLHYWLFVQKSFLGYRKLGKLTVTKYSQKGAGACIKAQTLVDGAQSECRNDVVLEDKFNSNAIDETKWLVEQYVPNDGPDYEFVSYQKPQCQVGGDVLKISPSVLTEEEIVRPLDLTNGCTRNVCNQTKKNTLLYPIKSGKLTSKIKLTYGRVEIKAKLPLGDWIYPEIYLETDSLKRIYIAFARGNKNLQHNGQNVGANKLYGGMTDANQGDIFTRLFFKDSAQPYSNGFHDYKIIWTPSIVEGYIDGTKYGEAPVTPDFQQPARLVLGVAVGGIKAFYDISTPWLYGDRDMQSQFYEKKNDWQRTWTEPSLQVQSVKIKAV